MFHLGPKPEHAPTAAEADHRSGHVGVPMLVDADVVRMGEAEDRGDASGIDQVVRVDQWCHVRPAYPWVQIRPRHYLE
jgi:hypothetical protein